MDVYETRAEQPATNEFIQVPPSMMRGLVELGVADECVRAGFPYDGIDMVDRRGWVLTREHTPSLAGLRYPPSLGLALDDLSRILHSAALDRGARLHRASTVVVDRASGKFSLHERPQNLPVADLVIVATGVHSKLSRELFPSTSEVTEYAQSWWSTVVRRDPALTRPRYTVGPDRRKSLVTPMSGQLAGLTYIHADAMPPQGEDLATCFARALADFPNLERGLAGQLDRTSGISVRPVISAILENPWSESGAIAVGECACALPPHFWQGTPLAIDDALVLGELLIQGLQPASLGKKFSVRRLARRREIHALTTLAARWDVAPERDTDLLQLSRNLSRLISASP